MDRVVTAAGESSPAARFERKDVSNVRSKDSAIGLATSIHAD
jgi:hypothetical protein